MTTPAFETRSTPLSTARISCAGSLDFARVGCAGRVPPYSLRDRLETPASVLWCRMPVWPTGCIVGNGRGDGNTAGVGNTGGVGNTPGVGMILGVGIPGGVGITLGVGAALGVGKTRGVGRMRGVGTTSGFGAPGSVGAIVSVEMAGAVGAPPWTQGVSAATTIPRAASIKAA